MKRYLVYTTDDLRSCPIDPIRFYIPATPENRRSTARVEKVGLEVHADKTSLRARGLVSGLIRKFHDELNLISAISLGLLTREVIALRNLGLIQFMIGALESRHADEALQKRDTNETLRLRRRSHLNRPSESISDAPFPNGDVYGSEYSSL
jgi:hypothetical protein